MSKELERAVMADRKRPCLYGVAPPCMHPKCLEAHYKTLKLQRTFLDTEDKELAQDEMKLPEGKTCGDCKYLDKCLGLFGVNHLNTVCDFYPSSFTETPE